MKIAQADIFVEIIDYLGDMGWVVEFLRMSELDLHFRIITNNREKMQGFLEKSTREKNLYEVIDITEYEYARSSGLIILGLHANVDLLSFPPGTAIIRVSYLTYDSWYVSSHDIDHILSTPERPIRELIYSPLPSTGGVWHYPLTKDTRKDWLEKNGLSENIASKIWIPIFCYEETLSHLDLRNIPEEVFLFFIGQSPFELSHKPTIPSSHHFPWLTRDDLWGLIGLSDISVLRGETSSLRGLMTRKPFLWDMYKGLGGWSLEESTGFLEYIQASESYREIHTRLNSGKSWSISNILKCMDSYISLKEREIPNFRETLQKTIDSFGISL